MRLPLAIAALAAVLVARVPAHAAELPGEPMPTGRILVERCIEHPMSLALQIAEAETARALTARSLSSLDEPVTATPAPARVAPRIAPPTPTRPYTPTPHACTSPGEPGCEVSAPSHAPGHVEFAKVTHDGALFVTLPEVLPPLEAVFVPAHRAHTAPTEAHAPTPWRPPAR